MQRRYKPAEVTDERPGKGELINEELAKGIIVGLFALRYGNNQPCRPMVVADSASVGLETGSKYGNCLHTKAAEELIPYMLGPMKGMRARLHEAIPRKDIPEVNQVYQLRKPNTFSLPVSSVGWFQFGKSRDAALSVSSH